MANVNITEASSSIVFSTRMWAGSDRESTAWLQSPVGSNSAEGGLNLLVVDLTVAGTGATTFDLTDTGITGVNGTAVIAFLGGTNPGASPVTTGTNDYTITGATVVFTAAAADVHRITILYR